MSGHDKAHRTLLFVGPFPPPVHGMSTTNATVFSELSDLAECVVKIDTASRSLDRSPLVRLQRLPSVLIAILKVALAPSGSKVFYASLSGGYGRLYECLFLLAARLRSMSLVVRHCSYAYLTKPDLLGKLLCRLAGESCTHIVQCDDMARRLSEGYGVRKIAVISNARLYEPLADADSYARTSLQTIGYLSNISREKGIFDFIAVAKKADSFSDRVKFVIAGPFESEGVRAEVLRAIEGLSNVSYVGPVYGAAKEQFLKGLDLFLFPTRYANETEAKVNLEALRYGVPVLSTAIGCIPDLLKGREYLAISAPESFAEQAVKLIRHWCADPAVFAEESRWALDRFAAVRARSVRAWGSLIEKMF